MRLQSDDVRSVSITLHNRDHCAADGCFASTHLQRAAVWLNRQQNDNQRLLLNASSFMTGNGAASRAEDNGLSPIRVGEHDEESLVRTANLDVEACDGPISLLKVQNDDY